MLVSSFCSCRMDVVQCSPEPSRSIPHDQTGFSGTSFCKHRHCHNIVAAVQIEFPVGDLGGFSCAEAEVRFSYKYKNLRTALSNIPQKDATGVNSKVRPCAPFILWLIHSSSVHPCLHPSIRSCINPSVHATQPHSHLSIHPFIRSYSFDRLF